MLLKTNPDCTLIDKLYLVLNLQLKLSFFGKQKNNYGWK